MKKELRKRMIEQLKTMDRFEYEENSKQIIEQFLLEPSVQSSELIGLTISRFPEVDTLNLIHKLWSIQKRVAVPKCNPKDRSMKFYEITSLDQLERVYFDLLEPIPEKTKHVEQNAIPLIVVPGVVFSTSGYRIGFGGGYYDRFLAHFNGETISLVFDNQIINEVPVEEHDIPVHRLLTENRRIECEERGSTK